MKNTTKGNPDFSYSSKSPSFLSKLRSCFSTHKSSYPSPLLGGPPYGVTTIPSKPVFHDKGHTKPSIIPSKPVFHDKGNTKPSIIPSKPVFHDKSHTKPSIIPSKPVFHDKGHTKPSTIPSKPVSPIKGHTTPSSSSSTIPSKPVSPIKGHTTPSSSSSTIPSKPVSPIKGHTTPSSSSQQNTDPSMSQAVWTLATGVGKLAFRIGKKAALLTNGVVKGGIEIAHNQIEHNEKLKETFACYYTDQNGTAYQGTLHFSNNQIVFSTDHPSHTTNENCNPPILPPGSSYKTKESELKLELKISFGEVIEINQVNAENPSTRYIQIRRVQGSNYAFRGFVDYYKAYNHIYSLLPSSS